MSGPPPPGGFNPGAFEFRPGQNGNFAPRQGQPGQQQGFDPYAAYGQQQGQQGYYPQQGQGYGGGYGGYGAPGQQQYYPQQPQQPPQAEQRAFVPGQRQTFVPPSASSRPVQGFQPPQVKEQRTLDLSNKPKAPVSLGGGSAKPAASLSIGGAAKPASISIGGAKPAASLSIGGKKDEKKEDKPALSIGGNKEEKKEEKPKEEAPKAAEPAAAAPAAPTPAPAASASTAAPQTETKSKASGTATPTNFSKVSSKTTAEAVEKDTAAADAEILADLYGDDQKDTNVKQHMNLVVVGHVDSGKSTCGGQLLYLNGAVDKRTMEKLEQEAKAAGVESWYVSWALDSQKEERAKGKTIETARAYFESDKRRYTILDAPGHKTYVPSMISGASQADIALLVISARKGEFENGFEKDGQTREHAMLVKNNGVNKLVLVINKMDVSGESGDTWSEDRFNEIKTKITPYLRSLGFNPKTDLTFIPVSAQHGLNMKDPIGKAAAPWYDGPSLLDFLDSFPITDRDINAPLMVPISEKYNELGTVIMGKIESGRVKKGDSVMVMPNKTSVEVAAIYTEQNDELDVAFCGDNVRLRLRGIEDSDILPGFVVTSPAKPVRTAKAFIADISVIESKNIIAAGFTCVLHVHTLAEEITISKLLNYFDRKTKRKSKKAPLFAKVGMVVRCLIETSAPICIEQFSQYKTLGRFTLRDEGRSIAIGKVHKIVDKDDISEIAGLSLA